MTLASETDYVSLSPSFLRPSMSSIDFSRTEDIETSSFSHHEDTSRLLLRRNSATSVATNTSYQVRTWRQISFQRLSQERLTLFIRVKTPIQQRMRRSRFYGWRMGLSFGGSMYLFVLCCNIIAIAVASFAGSKRENNIWDIVSESVTTTYRWCTAFHLIINVFSTILLAASNYTMQVFCFTTRSDVDAAHAKVIEYGFRD
ncbi:hypothetical protein SNOG_10864 [Parastagonospora nodorum SN15]|uniref:DUF6536 domain-containing protein n=1 Tax=Phaeosphaeria nodorum (strain SN15 / ATCC MYA-4574 / FGSC 10173) TaxID=321614 RepID=Q0UBK0_PHANO|nr:hypothetical protein SNOG_10864 [Parastagonospora nodorum SN15]EAT81363.1 hypothetical protein SNOG_10864 [Parastagonospora nodorum SN15]